MLQHLGEGGAAIDETGASGRCNTEAALVRLILGEISPAPDNLLNRNFRAATPSEKWLTDITEFQVPAGKVYLSPMIDCFDGMVVSWSIGTRPDAELVNTMLDAAIETVASSSERPVVHSDCGAHYRWSDWLSRIADAKLTRSMSRKGYSPANAACEGFFGRFKTELFYPRSWQSTTIEQGDADKNFDCLCHEPQVSSVVKRLRAPKDILIRLSLYQRM